MVRGVPDWATFVKTDPSEMIKRYIEVIEQGYAYNATDVIYTVPEEKILYIDSGWLDGFNEGAAPSLVYIYVRDEDDNFVYYLYILYLPAGVARNVALPIPVCISIPPGYDIVLTSSPDTYGYGLIHGWEE